VDGLLGSIVEWAAGRTDIEGVALVGSWARGSARDDSDVDVVILTTQPSLYLANNDWSIGLGVTSLSRAISWGALTERRARVGSGLDVEFGIAMPSWAGIDPVDPGTRRVVADGLRILYDPRGILARLDRSVNERPA
jgi:predicted nucleotidyltransferase